MGVLDIEAISSFQEVSLMMKKLRIPQLLRSQEGKIGYILAWALGVPIPILLLIFFLRGCD